jgi:hypothetical protein
MFREDTLKDPMYAKVVPPTVLAWYATEPDSGSSRSCVTGLRHPWT